MPEPDGTQFIEFSDPDGSQFQSLWDSAMTGAQANLDALSDEELEERYPRGAVLADPDSVGARLIGYPTTVSLFTRGNPDSLINRDAYGRSWEAEAGVSPNYDEPDPFDRSDPEQARQAKAIEDMNETLGE